MGYLRKTSGHLRNLRVFLEDFGLSSEVGSPRNAQGHLRKSSCYFQKTSDHLRKPSCGFRYASADLWLPLVPSDVFVWPS